MTIKNKAMMLGLIGGMLSKGVMQGIEPVRVKPIPPTDEQLARRNKAAEQVKIAAEEKRQRKAELKREQALRIEAMEGWKALTTDQQWELTRKYWPQINWTERDTLTIEHIVYIYKQVQTN